ncbi:Altered inheritance of mitochondria protein 32 [Kluyveromyces marxianus]
MLVRQVLNRQYQFKTLDIALKNQITEQCQCFVSELNHRLPKESQLDLSLQIPKKVPYYHKHVLMLTPKAGDWKKWPSKIELAISFPFNLVGPLKSSLKNTNTGSSILVNELDLPGFHSSEKEIKFLVIPDMKIYTVDPLQLPQFSTFLGEGNLASSSHKLSFADYLQGSDKVNPESQEGESPGSDIDLGSQFKTQDFHHDLILVCGHYNRDARCGELAPLLIDKLNSIRPTLKTGIVSHIGGHKFAGNIIYYQFNGVNNENKNNTCNVEGLWFSKMLPQNLETVLENLDQNIILQDFYRGHISYTGYK